MVDKQVGFRHDLYCFAFILIVNVNESRTTVQESVVKHWAVLGWWRAPSSLLTEPPVFLSIVTLAPGFWNLPPMLPCSSREPGLSPFLFCTFCSWARHSIIAKKMNTCRYDWMNKELALSPAKLPSGNTFLRNSCMHMVFLYVSYIAEYLLFASCVDSNSHCNEEH